jgi:hypothetical protein
MRLLGKKLPAMPCPKTSKEQLLTNWAMTLDKDCLTGPSALRRITRGLRGPVGFQNRRMNISSTDKVTLLALIGLMLSSGFAWFRHGDLFYLGAALIFFVITVRLVLSKNNRE